MSSRLAAIKARCALERKMGVPTKTTDDREALVELVEALLEERSIFAADHFDNEAWRIADDAADAAIRRFEEGA